MTGQDIFDISINLMDEQNESTGSTDTTDTKEYKLRTPRLLNSILPGLCLQTGVAFSKITSLTDDVPISDEVASGVAPYYLAALLIQVEGGDAENMAAALKQLGDNNLVIIRSRLEQAESESIEDLYGGIEYGEFSGDFYD